MYIIKANFLCVNTSSEYLFPEINFPIPGRIIINKILFTKKVYDDIIYR